MRQEPSTVLAILWVAICADIRADRAYTSITNCLSTFPHHITSPRIIQLAVWLTSPPPCPAPAVIVIALCSLLPGLFSLNPLHVSPSQPPLPSGPVAPVLQRRPVFSGRLPQHLQDRARQQIGPPCSHWALWPGVSKAKQRGPPDLADHAVTCCC